ncbi:MAG: hypothetical protein EBU88_13370 [Acidobacteria bacterium]|nr:hypothetical protein [Acidobacteriota bacterium]
MERSKEQRMSPQERAGLIERYAAGAEEVATALAQVPRDSWNARPLPGKWSAAEIVHHLADSEMTSAIRLRRLLVEDNPLIAGYDQDQFATRLDYNANPVEPAFEAFRWARAVTLPLLEAMSEKDWQRGGTHTEHGHYNAEKWLQIYGEHAHLHAAQIRRLAELLTRIDQDNQ